MAKRRQKVPWKPGDVFIVELKNHKFATGQVLGNSVENSIRIALFDELLEDVEAPDINALCNRNHLISLIEVTREHLDFGIWKIIGNKNLVVPIEMFPTEQFRKTNWVGLVTYDAAIAEDFLNAFHALQPWDDWFKKDYLDRLLFDVAKKPVNLIYTKQ